MKLKLVFFLGGRRRSETELYLKTDRFHELILKHLIALTAVLKMFRDGRSWSMCQNTREHYLNFEVIKKDLKTTKRQSVSLSRCLHCVLSQSLRQICVSHTPFVWHTVLSSGKESRFGNICKCRNRRNSEVTLLIIPNPSASLINPIWTVMLECKIFHSTLNEPGHHGHIKALSRI